jgi:hypothetical protein
MTRRVAMRVDRVFLRRDGRRTVSLMPRLLPLTDREAEPQGEASQRREPAGRDVVALLPATSTDRRELDRLAALDSAEPLQGDVLLGRVDGELRAALSRADGRVVADPFTRSTDVVALLRTLNH